MKSTNLTQSVIAIGLILFFLTACGSSTQVPNTLAPVSFNPTFIPPTLTPLLFTVIPTEIPPTETLIPPTDTLEPPTPATPFTLEFKISEADRQANQLIPVCERAFIITGDQVIVPYYVDCYHELLASSINGNYLGVVSPGADLGMLPTGGLAALFPYMRFVSYSLDGNTIQADSGKYWGTGQLWVTADAPDKFIVIVKLPTLGDWSGYVQSANPAFDLTKPVDQQPQPPLQEGNQFE